MLFKKSIDYSLLTKYDGEKATKRANYKLLNEKYALHNQTVLLGDSITDFFNYYELFYDFSHTHNQAVYNRGISGDTTDRLSERLYDNVLNINPKNLVLLIGTNDIGRGLPLSVTIQNVRHIMEETKKICPHINFVLQAVYPVNRNLRHKQEKRTNEKIIEMNKEFEKLCKIHDCTWLDFTKELMDADGNLSTEFTYDGLHVNAKAYEIIAKNIIPLLK